jgi:hypothetical protein
MKSYGSNRPGINLACFLAVFGIVVTSGSAIAQLVIDYLRDGGTVVVTFMELLGEIKDQHPRAGVSKCSGRTDHSDLPGLF